MGGDAGVSGDESIGFSTPAVGQLPWQQGQRVPTATADAVAEGEGLGPSVQRSSPVCLHPGLPGAQQTVGGTSLQPLGIPRLRSSLFSAFPIHLSHRSSSATAVALLYPPSPPGHVVSELVKRCFLERGGFEGKSEFRGQCLAVSVCCSWKQPEAFLREAKGLKVGVFHGAKAVELLPSANPPPL